MDSMVLSPTDVTLFPKPCPPPGSTPKSLQTPNLELATPATKID